MEIGIRGGPEDSLIPSLVMEASIKRHSPDTRVISTYHMDKPLMSKRKNPTPFSLTRFMVPQLCGYKGWGLYCDADQVVFEDVQTLMELVEKDPKPAIFIAKAHACTGVVLMDASRLKHWDAWKVKDKIDGGAQYGPMMRDLNGYGFGNMGDFGEEWNSRDVWSKSTKLLHFTNLSTQPWKVPGRHAFESVWADQLRLTIDDGFVAEDNLNENCRKILQTREKLAV